MKHAWMLATLPALALLAACGDKSATNSTDTVILDETVADDAGPLTENVIDAPALPAQDFANFSASSDAYEIASAKLAKEKSTSDKIKDFAAMLVTEHTDSTAQLKEAGEDAVPAITPDATLTAEQSANLDKLRAATGAGFDAEFKAQQISAHEKALAAMQSYAASGDMPSIEAFATNAAPVIEKHLGHAQRL
jgi:putative membrane protein